jgi:hypothetical protein
MEEARTVDELALTPEGERARLEAQEAVAALDLSVPPLPPPMPLEEFRRRANHREFMRAAFPRARRIGQLSRLRGRTVPYGDTEAMAWALGDESTVVPELPALPEPELRDGVIGGGSVTCIPRRPDPDCPMWGDPAADLYDRPEVPHVALEERWGLADVEAAVGEWLEGLYEPLEALELADLTNYPVGDVARALQALHGDGKVACQPTRAGALWVWRRWR